MPDEILAMDNYIMYREDNLKDLKGGILLYVKADIEISEISCKKLRNLTAETNEVILLCLKVDNKDILFGVVYRKGTSGAHNDSNIREIIELSSQKYSNIMICGDFNYPNIDWKSDTVNAGPYSPEMRFVNCLEDNYLTQNTLDFTRARGSDKPSTLDLIITDNNQTQASPIYEAPLGLSDHSVLRWQYLVSIGESVIEETKNTSRRNYYKGDYNAIRDACSVVNWTELLLHGKEDLSTVDLDNMVDTFYSEMKKVTESHIPLSKSKSGQKSELWWNKSLMKATKKKYFCWKRFQETKKHSLYLQYCKQRNKTAKAIRKAKREFEKKIAKEAKVNPKAFFKYCNSRMKKKSQIIKLKDEDNKIITSTLANAEKLNKYFCSVYQQESDEAELILNSAASHLYGENIEEPFENITDDPIEHKMESINVEEDEVLELLKAIDPTKSTSPFCIHPRVLKEAATELCRPIWLIYKVSLAQGKVPDCWKYGVVSPIHKGEDRHQAHNYRPITITSMLSRILEKIIKARVVDFITENNVLHKDQHGFIAGRSCLTNLLHTIEDLITSLDNGDVMDEILLDFAKAFDKVPHQRLLFKLRQYGISGNTYNWIESFLTSRKQSVRVMDQYSSKASVKSGVPQGSVLGPILFLVFINDLPSYIRSKIKLFADDTKIYRIIHSLNDADILQQDLNELVNWSEKWKMEFNASKCHVLHFSGKNKQYLYHIKGTLLKASDTEKDLGVLISKDLKPSKHIKEVVTKANQCLGMIRRSFSHIDRDIFLLVYKTFIRPKLEYCSNIWSPHLIKDINLLENVQRRATKMVVGLHALPYEERLRKLDLFSLQHRRIRGDMILVYKMFNGQVDLRVDDFFTVKEYQCTRGHNLKLELCRNPRTDIGHNAFSKRVIIPWNSLPSYVVNSDSVQSFKRNFDKHAKSC